MASLTKQSLVYLRREPSFEGEGAANHSDAAFVPCEPIVSFGDETEFLETNFAVGRGFRTPAEFGAMAWSLDLRVPAFCMSSSPASGASASTVPDDSLDVLLQNALGGRSNTTAQATTSVSGSTVTMPGNTLAVQQPVLVTPTSVAGGHYGIISAGTGPTYTVVPGVSAPSSGWLSRAAKVYRPSLGTQESLEIILRIGGRWHRLNGGRVQSVSLSADLNQPLFFSFSLRGTVHSDIGTSPPSQIPAAVLPSYARLRAVRSSVHFGEVSLEHSGIEVDFGLEVSMIPDSGKQDGYSGQEIISVEPSITVTPLYDGTRYADIRSMPVNTLVIGCSSGFRASDGATRSHGMSVIFGGAQYQHSGVDVAGKVRSSMQFRGVDRVAWTNGDPAQTLTLARF
jgi:hypothetical protein